MIGRVWSFVKRHKKKVLLGSLVGGAYGAYRYLYPMYKQFRELQATLAALERGLQAEGSGEARPSEEKMERFRHKQEVCDKHASKGFAELRASHEACFFIKECMSRVKEAQDAEAKRECLQRYVVECIAYCASALYALHALLLLQRMQFNIVGREVDLAELQSSLGKADSGVYEAFLESTTYFKEEGVRRVADSARRAASSCSSRAGVAATATVTSEQLQKLVEDVCLEVDGDLLHDSRAASLLLPESIDRALAGDCRERVKRLLDETRDYLESPQYVQVSRAIAAGLARRLAGLLGDGAPDPEKAPLAGGQARPLAKLLGDMISISNGALAEESKGGFVEQFAEEPLVETLCERVYFQNAGS